MLKDQHKTCSKILTFFKVYNSKGIDLRGLIVTGDEKCVYRVGIVKLSSSQALTHSPKRRKLVLWDMEAGGIMWYAVIQGHSDPQ